MSKVVTAPLVVLTDQSGKDMYLYRGASVPSSADPDHVKLLVKDGLIGDGEATTSSEDTAPGETGNEVEFDPAEHSIDDVLEYVGDDVEVAAAMAEAEVAGKNRSTLLAKLDEMTKG